MNEEEEEEFCTVSRKNMSQEEKAHLQAFLAAHCFGKGKEGIPAANMDLGAQLFWLTNRKTNEITTILSVNHDTGLISNVCTNRKNLRKGYARRLLQRVLREWPSRYHSIPHLQVWANNFAAISLYESLGFSQTATGRAYRLKSNRYEPYFDFSYHDQSIVGVR